MKHSVKTLVIAAVSLLTSASAIAGKGDIRTIRFESNVPANIKSQIIADLEFLASVQGSGTTPLHKEIFGNVDGENYAEWFTRRIKIVGLNNCGSPNAVACVIPWMGNDRFFITQNYIKFDHPAIARTMVVYHEARHTEADNNYWSHATCPTPFRNEKGEDMKSIWTGAALAGQPACDNTYMGSYGSSTILLRNINQACSNCTEKTRMDAGIYSDDQLGRVINRKAHDAIAADHI
jgi:hypothetical protein